MNETVNKNILNPYIEALLKRCSFLYGITYIDELRTRLSEINNLIIRDKMEKNVSMLFSKSKKEIHINKRFIARDRFGNYLITYDKASDYFKHSLFHELLHAASNRHNASGIISKGDEAYNTSLNEGITQMIADDLCGYYENKFLGSYNIEKIIALILRESLSNDIMLESYFHDEKILEYKVNNLAKSLQYYKFLNLALTSYCNSIDNTKKDRLDYLLKSITLNIILPTYYSLDQKKREKYLAKLLYSISGDEVVKNKIKDYISKYINYSDSQKKDEVRLINSKLLELESISDVMDNIEINLNKILVLNDGSIFILDDKRIEITSRKDKEKIYTKLFELNGYKKYLTDNVVKQYVDCVLKGKTLKIKQDSILKKRILFCGIKECLYNNGYYILNDFEELDKTDTIKLKYINRKVEYEDYKKICENFSICKNVDGNHKYSYSIIYDSTKNEVEDETIKKIAFYANNWLLSVQNNGKDGINEAFSLKNKKVFFEVFNKLRYVIENLDHFNIKLIELLFRDKKLIRKLLKTPLQTEWVYDYVSQMSDKGPIKEKKAVSYVESINDDYIIQNTSNEVREIIGKNK